jgi:hypothetical protein
MLDYIQAWCDAIRASDDPIFLPGVYCSHSSTAQQIRNTISPPPARFWVFNITVPPSPGCTTTVGNLTPPNSGVNFADVWQYSQD